MKLGIVIFPSKMIQDKANGLRKRYDALRISSATYYIENTL